MKRFILTGCLFFVGLIAGAGSVFYLFIPAVRMETEQVILHEQLSAFNEVRARFLSRYRKQPNQTNITDLVEEICSELYVLRTDAANFEGSEIRGMNIKEYANLVLDRYESLTGELRLDSNCSSSNKDTH